MYLSCCSVILVYPSHIPHTALHASLIQPKQCRMCQRWVVSVIYPSHIRHTSLIQPSNIPRLVMIRNTPPKTQRLVGSLLAKLIMTKHSAGSLTDFTRPARIVRTPVTSHPWQTESRGQDSCQSVVPGHADATNKLDSKPVQPAVLICGHLHCVACVFRQRNQQVRPLLATPGYLT